MQTGHELSYNKKMAEGQIHGEEPSNKWSCSDHRITIFLWDSGAYNNKTSTNIWKALAHQYKIVQYNRQL